MKFPHDLHIEYEVPRVYASFEIRNPLTICNLRDTGTHELLTVGFSRCRTESTNMIVKTKKNRFYIEQFNLADDFNWKTAVIKALKSAIKRYDKFTIEDTVLIIKRTESRIKELADEIEEASKKRKAKNK